MDARFVVPKCDHSDSALKVRRRNHTLDLRKIIRYVERWGALFKRALSCLIGNSLFVLDYERNDGLCTLFVSGILFGKLLEHEGFFRAGAVHAIDCHSGKDNYPDRTVDESRS
jgi:hypothetical protein